MASSNTHSRHASHNDDQSTDRRGSLAISALLNEESVDPFHSPRTPAHQEQTSSLANVKSDYFSQPRRIFQSSPTSPSGLYTPHGEQSNTWGALAARAPRSSGSIIGSSMAKAKRKRISADQFGRLIEVFEQVDTPSSEVREQLAEELNMTKREVQVWFQNRRAKVNKSKAAAATKSENSHRAPDHSRTRDTSRQHEPYRHHTLARSRWHSRSESQHTRHPPPSHTKQPSLGALPLPTSDNLPNKQATLAPIPSQPLHQSQPTYWTPLSNQLPNAQQAIRRDTAPRHCILPPPPCPSDGNPSTNHSPSDIHNILANLGLHHSHSPLPLSGQEEASSIEHITRVKKETDNPSPQR